MTIPQTLIGLVHTVEKYIHWISLPPYTKNTITSPRKTISPPTFYHYMHKMLISNKIIEYTYREREKKVMIKDNNVDISQIVHLTHIQTYTTKNLIMSS